MKPKEITKYYLGYEIAIHNNFREYKANEDIIISKCSHCGKPFDIYIYCANDACHDQHICCEECENTHEGFCSSKCTEYVVLNPDKNSHLRKLKKINL